MEAKNIKSVIDNLKQEKEVALVDLNKVREELNFGEDLLKLRGDKIHLLNEITALRLEVEDLQKSKKADFLAGIRGEISEFEAKKRSLSLEINELITAISSFKAEKTLLNKTLDEISQRIVNDEAVAREAIQFAFKELEAQQNRILDRLSAVSKRETEVKSKERDIKKEIAFFKELKKNVKDSLDRVDKKKVEFLNENTAEKSKIKNAYVVLDSKELAYKEKVAKKEIEFSTWEDELKHRTSAIKLELEEIELISTRIDKDRSKIKREKEDLKLSWEEYTRQNNKLKKKMRV